MCHCSTVDTLTSVCGCVTGYSNCFSSDRVEINSNGEDISNLCVAHQKSHTVITAWDYFYALCGCGCEKNSEKYGLRHSLLYVPHTEELYADFLSEGKEKDLHYIVLPSDFIEVQFSRFTRGKLLSGQVIQAQFGTLYCADAQLVTAKYTADHIFIVKLEDWQAGFVTVTDPTIKHYTVHHMGLAMAA